MGDKWIATSGVVDKWLSMSGKEAAIPAEEFAQAGLTLISVFDLISGMGMAKADMEKNANTVLKKAQEVPGSTLQDLVTAELEGKDEKAIGKIAGDGKTVTCALLWLVRALWFVLKMLEPLVNEPSKKMAECVNAGYEVSLKPHHGMIVKGTFSVALKAAPSRDVFLAKLAPSEAETKTEVDKVMPVGVALLNSLNAFLKEKNAKNLTAY